MCYSVHGDQTSILVSPSLPNENKVTSHQVKFETGHCFQPWLLRYPFWLRSIHWARRLGVCGERSRETAGPRSSEHIPAPHRYNVCCLCSNFKTLKKRASKDSPCRKRSGNVNKQTVPGAYAVKRIRSLKMWLRDLFVPLLVKHCSSQKF